MWPESYHSCASEERHSRCVKIKLTLSPEKEPFLNIVLFSPYLVFIRSEISEMISSMIPGEVLLFRIQDEVSLKRRKGEKIR